MVDVEVKRGYEVLPDNDIRFGIRITNDNELAVLDVEVILDYVESLFKLEGERMQKIGVIPPANTRTIEFVLKPLGCLQCQYRGVRTEFKITDMHESKHKMMDMSIEKYNNWLSGATLARGNRFWWKIDNGNNITIKRIFKNKNSKNGVREETKIIKAHELDLLNEYMADGYPKSLAHNVVKLANGTEKSGIGTFLYNDLSWLTKEAQLASHLGVIFYNAGVWGYNGKKRGIQHNRISDDWRELVTNLYNNFVM